MYVPLGQYLHTVCIYMYHVHVLCIYNVAQMDMTRSTGYRAVEELLKAQSTHMTLKRQFEEARVSEMTLAQREVREGGRGRGRETEREREGGRERVCE